jgi:hypothetical protein
MKNKILAILGLFIVFAIIFVTCEKPPIDKANEEYDFSKIIPEIFNFSGPTVVFASGLNTYQYSVLYRGGSTFNFTTVGWDATIVPVENRPNVVDITWNQSSENRVAYVVCVETTMGGVSSDQDSLKVILNKFCPMDITEFVGTWTGQETGDCQNAITVTFEAGTEANTIVANATNGIPEFLGCIFTGWGETFQAGFGNEGDIILHIDLLDGTITINLDYWGQTLPGPWDYWTIGSGSWSGCGASPSMSFNMGLDWDETGTAQYQSHLELIKQ